MSEWFIHVDDTRRGFVEVMDHGGECLGQCSLTGDRDRLAREIQQQFGLTVLGEGDGRFRGDEGDDDDENFIALVDDKRRERTP